MDQANIAALGAILTTIQQRLDAPRDDDLAHQDSHDAYLAVAKELGYDALGKPENDEAFEEYRLDPGTVTERRWELLNWQRPLDETVGGIN